MSLPPRSDRDLGCSGQEELPGAGGIHRNPALHGYEAPSKGLPADGLFPDVLEVSPDGLLLLDGDDRIVQVNRPLEVLSGHLREELLGRGVATLLAEPAGLAGNDPPTESSPRPDRLKDEPDRLKDEDVYRELRCRDGSRVPVVIRAAPVTVADRTFTSVTVRGITSRLITERVYRHQLDMLDRIPVAVAVVDITTEQVEYANRSAHDLLGSAGNELVGMPAGRVHPALGDRQRRAWWSAVLDGFRPEPATYAVSLIACDGTPRPCEVWVDVVTAGDGRPRVINVLRDRREQLSQQERLRAHEELFQLAFEQASEGMTLTRLDDDGNRIIVQANRAIAALLGESDPGRLIGHEFSEFLHPDDDAVSRHRASGLAHGRQQLDVVQRRLRRTDGRQVWVQAYGMVLQHQDTPGTYLLAHYVDVTAEHHAQRRRAGEALVATRLTEFANRLLAGMDPTLVHSDLVATAAQMTASEDAALVVRLSDEPPRWLAAVGPLARQLEAEGVPVHPAVFDMVYAAGRAIALPSPAPGGDPRICRVYGPNLSAPVSLGPGERAVLMVGRHPGADPFTSLERDLLDQFATQAAVVLTLARARTAQEQRIRTSEESFRLAFEQAPIGMSLTRVDDAGHRTIIRANAPLATFLGVGDPEDLVGHDWAEYSAPEDEADAKAFAAQILAGLAHSAERCRPYRCADGVTRWADARASVVPLPDPIGTVILDHLTDITERRQAEAQLRAASAYNRSLIEASLDPLVTIEPGGTITDINAATEQVTGRPRSELIGTDFSAYFTDPDFARAGYEQVFREGTVHDYALELRHRDGHITPVLYNASLYRDDSGQVLGVFAAARDVTALRAAARDVTALRAAETQLVHRVLHDELTGLPNRALLLDYLGAALARSRRSGSIVGLLFLDLDDFKSINDGYGHAAGDEFLIHVGECISGCLRETDVAARIGGDEFVIVGEGLGGPTDAEALAERIQHALDSRISLRGQQVSAPASIGIAISSADSTPEDLLRDADAAMYVAKHRGGRRWEPADLTLHAAALRVLTVESELHRAVQRDELRVYYQPMVDLQSDRLVAVEALLRWQHPEHGLLLPEAFLDVAEQRDMIGEIGAWVLTTACAQAAQWVAEYGAAAPGVAVNVFPRQLGNQRLATQVDDTLASTGLAPDHLCLEITESQLIAATGSATTDLDTLSAAGVRIAVDDFGTGCAGCEYLRRIPVDELKIDKSFVSRLGTDATDTAIASSIIALGESLQLTVVAEGIETPEQRDIVRELGCAWGQGWLWHQAQPAARIDTLLSGASKRSARKRGNDKRPSASRSRWSPPGRRVT